MSSVPAVAVDIMTLGQPETNAFELPFRPAIGSESFSQAYSTDVQFTAESIMRTMQTYEYSLPTTIILHLEDFKNMTPADRNAVMDYFLHGPYSDHQHGINQERKHQLAEWASTLAASDRLRNAQNVYHQNRNEMNATIHSHTFALQGLTLQLVIMKAQHARQHTALDVLDANALSTALDNPHGPENAARSAAQVARAETRAANLALQESMAAEIAGHYASIADAEELFEQLFRRGAQRAARIALRKLSLLTRGGAKVPKGEHGLAFWNGVRRAAASPTALVGQKASEDDMEMLEQYRRELQRPEFRTDSVLAGEEGAIERYGEAIAEERGGLFSVSGWAMDVEA